MSNASDPTCGGASPEDASPDDSSPDDPPGPAGPLRVLIVDDNRDVRQADALRLERLGHKATICADPREALALCTADPDAYDLVLADQVMSHGTGLQLARRLQEESVDIPFVIMSGYSADLTPEAVEAAGVQAVLWKPFRAREVTEMLREVGAG